MKLYDLNKAGYASIPTLTEKEAKQAVELIKNFLEETEEKYYMVLNHDVHYYTMYNWRPNNNSRIFAQDVYSLLEERGSIKAVELSENGDMIEFWIYNSKTEECNMYGFFPYDQGVIEI